MENTELTLWICTLILTLMLGLVTRCLVAVANILNEIKSEQSFQLERIGDNTETEKVPNPFEDEPIGPNLEGIID